MKIDLIFIIILAIVIAYVFAIYKIEKMGDVTQLSQDQVKDMIKQIYLVDVEAIRNLSNVATQLQAGGLTIPGNLTVKGELNIQDANTKLVKGIGNSLRISTPSGYIEIGSQNDGWGHIYTDRPKFAFNKPVTDVATLPYNDYIKTNDKSELQGNINNLQKNVTNLQDTSNDYVWGIGMRNEIYRCKAPCDNSAWEQIGGTLRGVSVGKTYIYGIGSDGATIWRCKKPCQNAQWEKLNGALLNVTGD